jgi:DNA-binding XRE family transcriptional regulator
MGIPKRTQDSNEIVSQRVNHLMFINGRMTQKRLATRLGVAAPTIATKLMGRNRWNLEEVPAVCAAFGVTPNYMFGYEPIEAVEPRNAEFPASEETGNSGVVAGAVFSFMT